MYKELRIQLSYFARKNYYSYSSEMLNDCVSDAIVELLENPPPEEVSACPEILFGWSRKILEGKIYHTNRRAALFIPLEPDHDVPDSFDIQTKIEVDEIVEDALGSLTDKEKGVILMQSYCGYTYDQMAKIYKVTTHAIKGVLANAKRKMQMTGNPPPSITVPI